MDIWILIIAELIWLMISPLAKVAADVAKCDSGKEKNSLNCSFKGPAANKATITEFPKSINFNKTESLDISDNKLDSAVVADLKKFTNLVRFTARGVKFETDGAVVRFTEAITSFKKLEELDLTGTRFSNTTVNLVTTFKITWPTTLKRVTLRGMNLENASFSTLDDLEELDLSLNKFTTLPKLHKSAPVTIINLSDNPLDNITVEQVAPYCQMTAFLLQGKSGQLEKTYSLCAPLEQWLIKYHIVYGSLSCAKSPSGKDSPKSITFSEQALKNRQECEASQPSMSLFEILLMAIFFFILFPILYFVNESYQNYQSRRRSSSAIPMKHHKHKDRVTHEPSEVDYDYDYGESEEFEV